MDASTEDDAQFDLIIVPEGDIQLFLEDQEMVADTRRLGSSARDVLKVTVFLRSLNEDYD